MLIEASKEAMLALELFQLDPASVKSKELLNQHLVEVAMYIYPNKHSLHEITSSVLELLKNAVDFGEMEGKEALDHSCARGRTDKRSADNYFLSDKVKNLLESSAQKIDFAEKEFDKGLADYVGRQLNCVLDPFAEAVLCRSVKETIQAIFYQDTLKLRKLANGECDFTSLFDLNAKAIEDLKNRLVTFISLQRNASTEAIIRGAQLFLGNLSDGQKHYVANLYYRVFYFQILNVDPKLRKLENECFKATKLYLDTNVVIRYLCEGAAYYRAITDVINMSKKLGVRLFVSTMTLHEAQNLIKEAKRFGPHLNDGKISAALRTNPVAVNNPIIGTYIKKQRDNRRLNWAAFIAPFENLELFLIANDIETSDNKCVDITSDQNYSKIQYVVSDLSKDTKGQPAPQNVIDHDTYNLILVQKLRETFTGTMLGSSVWLLTIDRKLPKVDRVLRDKYPSPHCQTVDQWGSILLPFNNVENFMATDSYISYLVSQQLGAMSPQEIIDIHFFEELERAEINIDAILGLEPDLAFLVLVDLQKDREVHTLLSKMSVSADEDKESFKDEFRDKALQSIKKTTSEEKAEYDREIARLQDGVNFLLIELKNMKSANITDKEKILVIERKLHTTEQDLRKYEHMSLWQKIKNLFIK